MKTLIVTLIVVLSVSAITVLLLRSGRRSAGKTPFPAEGSRVLDTWQDSISPKSERDWQPPQRNRDSALDQLMTEEQLLKVRAPQN